MRTRVKSKAVKKQHDPMFFEWSYTGPPSGPHALQVSTREPDLESITRVVRARLEPTGASAQAGGAADERPQVPPGLELSGASEHAGGATDEGRPVPELLQDETSSRGSHDWDDQNAKETDGADDQDAESDGADDQDAERDGAAGLDAEGTDGSDEV